MSETKEESNSVEPDIKPEESSPKEESKAVDESSKDSEKDSAKDESMKEESDKESDKESIKNESESEEEGMGLLDRPVEVTGCRARKKVERLTVSFTTPKEKALEIAEGKGQKLGDCPRIEHQIQKTSVQELKALHRIFYGRLGSVNEIKKNIRKFSGFPFAENSAEYDKKKATFDKLSNAVLKQFCVTLDLERSGHKDDIVARLLNFLLCPKDSGKKVASKKRSSSKSKEKGADKKADSKKSKSKNEKSEEVDSANESASEEASNKDEDEESDEEDVKKKSKNSKPKKAAKAVAKKTEKKEKPKKDAKKEPAKGAKRKRDNTPDDSGESSDDEPIAKKSNMPSDDEIKKLVKRILDAADLQEITMKKVIKQVADAYPDCDLSHKKKFIKETIKSVIS